MRTNVAGVAFGLLGRDLADAALEQQELGLLAAAGGDQEAVLALDASHRPAEVVEVLDPLLLDLDGFSYRQRFVMQSVAGEWRISEPPWPYFCPERS